MQKSNARPLGRLALVGLGAASAIFAAGALFLSTSEAMLRAQFVSTFDSYPLAGVAGEQRVAGTKFADRVPVAGGEDFWLSGGGRNQALADSIRPASWRGPLAVGDEITVSGSSGRRTYRIVAITDLPMEGVTETSNAALSGLLLVTAVTKDANPEHHVRFVVERTGVAGEQLSSNTL